MFSARLATFVFQMLAPLVALGTMERRLEYASLHGFEKSGSGIERLAAKTSPQQSANQTQLDPEQNPTDTLEVIGITGSWGEDRTPDLGIMRPSLYH